jgi:hypothetical protein
MNNIRLIYESLLSVAIVSAFFISIYYRLKTLSVRFRLRKDGSINSEKLLTETLINIGFWVIPMLRYRMVGSTLHNRYAKKCNTFLLLFIVFSIILLFTHKILW